MEIDLRTRTLIGELTVRSGNASITEDIVCMKNGDPYIPEDIIERFITVANEMSRFNDVSDVDFVLKIAEAFLNDSERRELIEKLQK